MWKLTIFVAGLVDSLLVVAGSFLCLWYYYHGDVERGIFWVLIALFFGRGQKAD